MPLSLSLSLSLKRNRWARPRKSMDVVHSDAYLRSGPHPTASPGAVQSRSFHSKREKNILKKAKRIYTLQRAVVDVAFRGVLCSSRVYNDSHGRVTNIRLLSRCRPPSDSLLFRGRGHGPETVVAAAAVVLVAGHGVDLQ